MSKFYFWLSAFIILTAIATSLPDKGIDSVPPIAYGPAEREKALPPMKGMTPEGEGVLKAKNRHDPEIFIEAKAKAKRTISTGTAFALSEDGWWGTAQHVTSGCDKILVLVNPRQGHRVVEVIQHPTADVSLIRTDDGAEAFQIETEDLQYSAEGFHFGYPRGEPGNIYSQLIGRRIIKQQGARNNREPVLVWAEKVRQPDHDLPLGGISGGPVLNAQGHLVGVHIAGSVRRGRSYSSLPETVTSLLRQINYQGGSPTKTETYDLAHLGQKGDMLRKRLSVAKVVCLVN